MITMKNWRWRRRGSRQGVPDQEHEEGALTNTSLTGDTDVEEQWPRKRSICQTLRRDAHAKCLVLTSLLLACLVAVAWCRLAQVSRLVVNFQSFPIATRRRVSPCDEGYVYIPVAFLAMLYVVYLVECWHCSTRLSLAYRVEASTVYEHVRRLREAQPVIWWKAVCYHYVRRSRQVTRYRNGDAYTTTQTYYERVNSHATGSCFVYSSCGVRDISRNLVGLERFAAVKLRFSKGFAFADPRAADEFEGQRARFFTSHERLDDYLEMREGLELVGADFQEYMVAFADKPPWYVSQKAFWILSLLLLSWPLRFVIECQTAYVHYQVTKLFGGGGGTNVVDIPSLVCGGHATRRHSGGRSSRGSTTDSVELERHISDNFTLAPSYSEALLLLPPNHNGAAAWRNGVTSAAPVPDANGNIRDFSFNPMSPAMSIPLNGDDPEPEEDDAVFTRVGRERRSSLWRWAASRFSWGRSSTGISWPSASYWSSRNNLGHRNHHGHHLRPRRPSSPFPGTLPNGSGGLPVSLSRVSLANGHVVYLVSPLRSDRDSFYATAPRGLRRTFTCPQNAGAPEIHSPTASPTSRRHVFNRSGDIPSPQLFPPGLSAFLDATPSRGRPRHFRSRSQDEFDEAPLPTYEEALRLTAPILIRRETPGTTSQEVYPNVPWPTSTSQLAATSRPTRLTNNQIPSLPRPRVTRSHTYRDFNAYISRQRGVRTSSSCLEFREVDNISCRPDDVVR